MTETKIFLSPSHASDLTIKIHQWLCGGCEMVWKRAQLYLGPWTINWSLDFLQDFKRGSDCAKGKLVWILCMISWSWHDHWSKQLQCIHVPTLSVPDVAIIRYNTWCLGNRLFCLVCILCAACRLWFWAITRSIF